MRVRDRIRMRVRDRVWGFGFGLYTSPKPSLFGALLDVFVQNAHSLLVFAGGGKPFHVFVEDAPWLLVFMGRGTRGFQRMPAPRHFIGEPSTDTCFPRVDIFGILPQRERQDR